MRCRLITLLLILVLVFPVCACAEEDMLYPACGEQELWGYINIRGEWVIPPQYGAAYDFGKAHYTVASTVDGYDGIVFCRFLADCGAKGNVIFWDKML